MADCGVLRFVVIVYIVGLADIAYVVSGYVIRKCCVIIGWVKTKVFCNVINRVLTAKCIQGHFPYRSKALNSKLITAHYSGFLHPDVIKM